MRHISLASVQWNPHPTLPGEIRTLAKHSNLGRRTDLNPFGYAVRRPHHTLRIPLLFTELALENCINSCFKWFSNVFERLKPNSSVFSTNSLSRYKTTVRLLFILRLRPSGCEGTFSVISLMLVCEAIEDYSVNDIC